MDYYILLGADLKTSDPTNKIFQGREDQIDEPFTIQLKHKRQNKYWSVWKVGKQANLDCWYQHEPSCLVNSYEKQDI